MEEDLVKQLMVGRAVSLQVRQSAFQLAWLMVKSLITGKGFKEWQMELNCRIVSVDE